MVDLERGWQPSVKLNVIAGALDFTSVDPIPADVSRDRIEEYCYALRDLYGEYVDELVAETTLSGREAQAWALRNLAHEGQERLSYEAVGLYIWAIGRATEGDPLSRTIVSKYHERAQRKMRRAEETVKRRGAPPYPDDVYDQPAVLWVEGSVGERLQGRAGPEETYSDLIERLLEETVAEVTLEALVGAYRDERGTEYVAAETLGTHWDETLGLVVHAPDEGDRPAPVVGVEVLVVDGERIPLTVEEREQLRRERSHLPVFDAGSDDPVTPEKGRDRLLAAIEAVERDLPAVVDAVREDGAVALAVDGEPAAAGAHLYPVYPGDAEGRVPLAHLERIALDDRTLAVGRVSPLTAAEYETGDAETTLLWADPEGPGGPVDLPEDPVDRRERLPAKVLRTA